MIRHTVIFTLKHAPDSPAARDFFQAACELSGIPGVRNFECLRQVSAKCPFQFGLSMEFDTQADYDAYSAHPEHTRFVQTRWIPEVSDFMEVDYVAHPLSAPQ